MKNENVKRTFVKKGSVVVVKTEVKPIELTSKDIMNDITSITNGINQTENQINTSKKQLVEQENQLEALKESLKEVKKFEDWAKEVQLSKIKALKNIAIEKAKKKVDESYDYDNALTADQNITQKYHMFREYVVRDEDLNDKISNVMLRAHLSNIPNPWL